MDDKMIRAEVDAWERRRLRIKQFYISQGRSEEDADDRATEDVRRSIRESR